MSSIDPKILSCKGKDGFWQKSFFYLSLLAALLIFFFYMIQNLLPFCHTSESVYVTADAFFLFNNIRWLPIPHLDLPCDFFAYPYRFNPVFLTWMLEHDYFAGLLMSMFGFGPWEQIYWMISLGLSAIIPYILLRRYGHYENWRSALFALLVTFCNYAVICKYPSHYTLVIYHWVVISFVMDFLILKKYFDRENYSATFVLLKIMFLIFCLGLELGYIAGMAFCSTFIVCVYIFLCELIRSRSFVAPFYWYWNHFLSVYRDFRSSRINYLFTAIILAALLLYLPIVIQIVIITKTGSISLSPLIVTASWRRIFLPIFPWLHPAMFVKHCLVDPRYGVADTIYANCVGWSFLLVFIGGFIFSRKKIWLYLPFALLVFLIYLIAQIPVLKFFPLFSYARFSERFSAALVPLICMAILCFDMSLVHRKITRIFISILIPLFFLECVTAYNRTFTWIESEPIRPLTPKCKKVIKKLQEWPGEAICFLPFSIAGGDNSFISLPWNASPNPLEMQFAAFARKKTNNFYGGRLDLTSGELPLMQKCSWDCFSNQLLQGALSEENLKTFENFVKGFNFSAIVLFDRLLPERTKQQLLKTFGPSETISFNGYLIHVIFLSDSFRKVHPPNKEIRFYWDYPVEIDNIVFIKNSGFSENWAASKDSHLFFSLKQPERDLLISLFGTPFLHKKFPRNNMSLFVNGTLVRTINFQQNTLWENQIVIPQKLLVDGDNDFLFHFDKLKRPSDFGEIDRRRLGFHFSKIRLEELPYSCDIAVSGYPLLFGFSGPEINGSWTCQKEARIELFLARPEKNLILSFEGFPFLTQNFPRNEMSVSVNGKDVGTIMFELGKDWKNRIRISKELIRNGRNNLVFRLKDLKSPSGFDGQDSRKLGFFFSRIKVCEE